MKIDPGDTGFFPKPEGLLPRNEENPANAFSRKIKLIDVRENTISIDDLLQNNGFKKARKNKGMGSFGRVYPVQSQDGHDLFALKIARFSTPLKKSELSSFLVQDKGIPVAKAYFGLVRHKVERYLDVIYSMDQFEQIANSFELAAVGLEYIDGDTFSKYLKKFEISGSPIPEEKMFFFAQEVSHGISLFNEGGLVHRDLKPDNLMYCPKENKVIFIDFSTVVSVDEAKNKDNDGVTGTEGYMSPEAYESQGNPGIKDDSWALGATLTKIPFGKTPNEIYDENAGNKLNTCYENTKGFAEWDDDTKMEMILKEFKDGLSENKRKYVDVIIDLTKRDVEERITTTEAYQRLSAITGSSVENVSEQECLDTSLNGTISNDSDIDISVHADEAESLSNSSLSKMKIASDTDEGNGSQKEYLIGKTDGAPVTKYEPYGQSKRTRKKPEIPLSMSFEQRQNKAAKARNDRDAEHTLRADAEKQWVKSFREKVTGTTNKKKQDETTKANRDKK